MNDRISSSRFRVVCLLIVSFVPALPILAQTATGDLPLPGAGSEASASASAAPSSKNEPAAAPKKIVKSDKEWAKLLTRPQFMVTRMKATEPPFSGAYVNNHLKGTYLCVCCGAPLFSSRTKFEIWDRLAELLGALRAERIDSAMDYSAAEARVEVMCYRCGAHLGHVFTDGPPPTGLRYCINSLSLKFAKETRPSATDTKAAKSKTTDKEKAKEPAKASDESATPEGSTPAPRS